MLAYIQERNALRKLNENNKNSNKNQESQLPTNNNQKIVKENKKDIDIKTINTSPKIEEVKVKELPLWRVRTSLNTTSSLIKKEEVKEITKKTEDLDDEEGYETEDWNEKWDKDIATTTYSGLYEKTNEDIQKILVEEKIK